VFILVDISVLLPVNDFNLRDKPMWCPSCRADVAAELSTDNRRMLCARCQSELGFAAGAAPHLSNTPRTMETERDARELLARWSAHNLLEPPVPIGTNTFVKPAGMAELPSSKSELRFDLPRSSILPPTGQCLAAAKEKQSSPSVLSITGLAEPTDQPVPTARPKKVRRPRVDTEAHIQATPAIETASTGPHESSTLHSNHDQLVRDALQHPGRNRPSLSTLAGQLCAYSGVGLLTCGTVLVMWSYFGGPSNYMPTGWLTAAVGQMLLFLGVITLISSGMDQTVSEVTWRIDHLAEEVHHMSLALDQLEHEHRQKRFRRRRSEQQQIEDDTVRDAA
jgi:hypothetical protein